MFRTLTHAYFHGYAVNKTPTINASTAMNTNRTQAVKSTQTSQLGSATTSVKASDSSLLIDQSRRTSLPSAKDFWRTNRNEAETLIIEVPFADYVDIK